MILPKLRSSNSYNIDPHEAYSKGTTGSLELDVQKLTLYAPSPWMNRLSLNSFMPSDHPLAKLLCHDFGKGYVMRNLSGCNWNDLFYKLLEWQYEIPVNKDMIVGSYEMSGTSQDVIPFSGTMTIDFNKSTIHSSPIYRSINRTSIDFQSEKEFDEGDDFYEIINPFCQKYNLFSPSGPKPDEISLCVLKKDGSWDPIWTTHIARLPIEIDIDKLPLNFDEDQYARGTTGGLRYRLTKCESKGINRYHDNEVIAAYTTKYFTRDFRPQKPQIKYTKSLSSPLILTQERSTYDYDDYFVNVNVGISNVEGTNKIIVEQLDEGETLPFQYEVDKEEFRNGYFIANLDRECSTQLTVVSYNDNGFQRSNTIMIPAIGYPQEELSVELLNGVIHIYGLNPNALLAGEYTYMAQRTGIFNPTSNPQPLTANYIELPSRYVKGIYLLTIFKNNKSIGSFKIQLV